MNEMMFEDTFRIIQICGEWMGDIGQTRLTIRIYQQGNCWNCMLGKGVFLYCFVYFCICLKFSILKSFKNFKTIKKLRSFLIYCLLKLPITEQGCVNICFLILLIFVLYLEDYVLLPMLVHNGFVSPVNSHHKTVTFSILNNAFVFWALNYVFSDIDSVITVFFWS